MATRAWLILGGRRPVRRLSPRLRRADAGGLYADHRHAAGPGLSRRRLRVSLAHGAGPSPYGTSPSSAAPCWPPSPRAWFSVPSSKGVEVSVPPRLCRRLVGDWLSPFRPADRRRRRRRLRPSGRHLAEHEDGRRAPGPRPRPGLETGSGDPADDRAPSAWPRPFLDGEYARRWFDWPGVLLTAQVPLLVLIVAGRLLLDPCAASARSGPSCCR